MTTVTKTFSPRLEMDHWVVTWGKGLTETAICLTEAEAVTLAARLETDYWWVVTPGQGSVEPLVSFR